MLWILCVLCGSEEETTSHLLISFPIANAVWNLSQLDRGQLCKPFCYEGSL